MITGLICFITVIAIQAFIIRKLKWQLHLERCATKSFIAAIAVHYRKTGQLVDIEPGFERVDWSDLNQFKK